MENLWDIIKISNLINHRHKRINPTKGCRKYFQLSKKELLKSGERAAYLSVRDI